jgi:aspartate/methionine/tyrosine aminotransferase
MTTTQMNRVIDSPYMQWAKGHVHAEFNLAASGLASAPISMLPFTPETLNITGNSYYGYTPLQEALARHCGLPAERIFSTLGTSLANHLAMAALLSPGDEVVIEEPSYELIIRTALYLGATVRRFPRRRELGFQIDPDDVARSISDRTRLVIITNLHNPTSVRTPDSILKSLSDLLRRRGSRLLVDEVYLDADFGNAPKTAAHIDPNIIVTNSLTKVYGLSGLRCGWVTGDPVFIRKLWHLNDLYEVIPPHVTEQLSAIALDNLSLFRDRAHSILQQNHAAFRELIAGLPGIEVTSPGFGTVAFARLLRGTVADLEAMCLERFRTAIAPGRFFDAPEYFRIGLGGEPEMTAKGLENLRKCLLTHT